MPTPLVSICLPNLNSRSFLEERLNTILNQSITDWELIICDSHSSDGAWEFFQSYKKHPRIQIHQVPRQGPYPGWNECLRRATGKFVYIATSDDTMTYDCLEKLASALDSNPAADSASCDFLQIDANSQPLPDPTGGVYAVLSPWLKEAHWRLPCAHWLLSLLHGPSWVTVTSLLFRRTLLDKIGLFNSKDLDWGWALDLARTSTQIYIPGKLATWRRHSAQYSNPKSILAETLRYREICHRKILAYPHNFPNYDILPNVWNDYWIQKIREESGLYRYLVKKSPAQFLKAFRWNLMNDPRWFFTQAIRAYAPTKMQTTNGPDAFQKIVDILQISQLEWPPPLLRDNHTPPIGLEQ